MIHFKKILLFCLLVFSLQGDAIKEFNIKSELIAMGASYDSFPKMWDDNKYTTVSKKWFDDFNAKISYDTGDFNDCFLRAFTAMVQARQSYKLNNNPIAFGVVFVEYGPGEFMGSKTHNVIGHAVAIVRCDDNYWYLYDPFTNKKLRAAPELKKPGVKFISIVM